MKKIILLTLSFSLFLFAGVTWAQITLPSPSPAGSVYSKVGLTDVEITYSRPKLRDRQIFGTGDDYLLQFGEVWRTGANSGTVLKISDPITIQGNELASGEYLILSIPGANEWTVIFYGDPSLGGNITEMEEEKVAMKVTVKPVELMETVQVLTINISDIHPENTGAAIEVAWENTSVKVPFEVKFEDKVMAAIEASTTVRPQNYMQAARYYYDSGKDPQQALKWVEKYFAANDEYRDQFWNLFTMAQIQQAAGDAKGAKATSEESLERAEKSDDDFGYIKRNQDFLASLNQE